MVLNKFQKILFICLLTFTPLLFNPYSGFTEGVKLIIFINVALLFFILNLDSKYLNDYFKYLFAGIIIFGGISVFLSTDSFISFWGSYDRSFGFAVFLAAVLLALGLPKIKTKDLINTLIISGTITSIVAIIFGLVIETSLFEGRISGTLGNPNLLGQFLIVPLFFAITKFTENKNKIDLLQIIIQGLALFLTGNRASILALLIITFIYFFISKKSWKVWIIALFVFGSVFLLSIDRFLSYESVQTRLEVYSASLSAILKNPFFGAGFEQVQTVLKLPETYTMIADRAHQFFLDLSLSGGIPFMIAFAALSIFSITVLLKKEKILGLAFLGLLLSLQFNFMGIVDMLLFAVFIGLARSKILPLHFAK